jgi:hypothetical protein
MVSNKPPTLTDARGLGGIIAQDGFDYQLWDGLLRLPSWLANPAFDQLLFEGFEDLEARFFTPYASQQYLLERYQAKSAVLTPLETTNVFDNFLALEAAAPNHTRLYSLVTPQLAPTLKWLSRDADRVRQARPFYAPFPAVMVASDAKLKDDLTYQFGSTIGEFVAEFLNASFQTARAPSWHSALRWIGPFLSSMRALRRLSGPLKHSVDSQDATLASR